MENFGGTGKILVIIGCLIMILGIIILITGKVPFLGKLPGDFSWKGKNWSVYFPIGTSVLISIILSFIFWLIRKF
jgi:ribose/xylose/arabinose/galactoside ABC-type transport system permease subunit